MRRFSLCLCALPPTPTTPLPSHLPLLSVTLFPITPLSVSLAYRVRRWRAVGWGGAGRRVAGGVICCADKMESEVGAALQPPHRQPLPADGRRVVAVVAVGGAGRGGVYR